MSRVIKSAIWQDEPKVVERPAKIASPTEAENLAAQISPEAQMIMLQEKEEQVKKMRMDTETFRNKVFADVQKEADIIKSAAEAAAVELKAAAEAEGQETGYAAGYEAGLKAAQAEQRAAIDAANEKAARTLAAAQEKMRNCLLLAERQIVDMTLHIVDKILPQHFIDVPQVILPLVRRALEKMKDQSGIVIRVAPDNYEFVIMAKNEFQAMLEGNNEPIQVQADPSLQNGDCVVESLNGSVDARLATQMELIKKSIQEVME